MTMKKEIAKELFSPVIRKFQTISIQTHYKDECWSLDLIDRFSVAKSNKNFKFIFIRVDNHTEYAWAVPLRVKSGKSTKTALKNTIEEAKRKPDKMWSDRGKKFYHKTFSHFTKDQNIQMFSFNSGLKAVSVELFNRTLLNLIKEPMYYEGKACWLNHLDAAMEKYNSRVHGTAKMTPFKARNDKPIPKVFCISSLKP